MNRKENWGQKIVDCGGEKEKGEKGDSWTKVFENKFTTVADSIG